MLQSLHLTIGRTWRLATAGGADVTVDRDLGSYTDSFGALKQQPTTPRAWDLPWPTYTSTFWRAMLGDDYRRAPNDAMARVLVPLLHDDPSHPEWWAFRHPFAVTTVIESQLKSPQPWPTDAEAATWLDGVLRGPAPGHGGFLADGLPVTALPDLPTEDAEGHPVTWQPAGGFRVLSAIHQDAPSPQDLAGKMAVAFEPVPPPTGVALRELGTFVAVRGSGVGLVRPRAGIRVETRLTCLHHNQTVALAHANNLLAGLAAPATPPAMALRARAALVLNHLYRNVPVPPLQDGYRCRLIKAWLTRPGVAGVVNDVNAEDLAAALPAIV